MKPDLKLQRGMTLVELLTVVAILAIISSIAVSSYRNYTLRANRTEAKSALLRVQVAQEKFFLQKNRYADGDELSDAPPDGLGVPETTPNSYYAIAVETDEAGTSYTATATAQNGQLDDKEDCHELTIDQGGTKTPDENTGCWK